MSTPHCTATIDLGALAGNVRTLLSRTGGAELMAVVKADAYGHGLVPCARAAVAGGATWLATALLDEAIALRDAGVSAKILSWLYPVDARFAECIERDIDLGANSARAVRDIANAARSVGRVARIHVKVDTGLGRNGVMPADLPELIAQAQADSDAVRIVGVMSHFAYADEPSNPTIAIQGERFVAAVDALEAAGFELEVRHLSNSAATLGLPHTYFNLVRPGVAIYGVSPGDEVGTPQSHDLTPVLRLTSTIALIKEVPAGTGVSYAHAYHTSANTRLALIPVGYADGLPRASSNRGPVLVGGRTLQVAGRMCMDQFLVDIGDLPVNEGDEVVIFGDPGRGEPSAEDWGRASDTIGYEIITRLGPRVVRDYINAPW